MLCSLDVGYLPAIFMRNIKSVERFSCMQFPYEEIMLVPFEGQEVRRKGHETGEWVRSSNLVDS